VRCRTRLLAQPEHSSTIINVLLTHRLVVINFGLARASDAPSVKFSHAAEGDLNSP
jgi:hypothetical protein